LSQDASSKGTLVIVGVVRQSARPSRIGLRVMTCERKVGLKLDVLSKRVLGISRLLDNDEFLTILTRVMPLFVLQMKFGNLVVEGPVGINPHISIHVQFFIYYFTVSEKSCYHRFVF
jgi:hypothetical protein